jgi:hypothetical protein
MADFALWATACEPALWPAGTFWSAYCHNRDEAVEGVIEADPIANAVRALVSARSAWTGTASQLLGDLTQLAGDGTAKSKEWPSTPRALSGRLRRAATFLRKVGIEVNFGGREGKARNRIISIVVAPENGGVQPSASSAPSASLPGHCPSLGRTVAHQADDSATSIVSANALKNSEELEADGADAKIRSESVTKDVQSSGWRARI